jgi:acyl CoA:acetate/3-ketoacid CoA transferase beta subunit
VIARRSALELKRGMTANLGFGISAMVPRILLEEGHPDAVTWAIEQGAVGGMPLTDFAFGCASNADAFVPSPQQFIYFQGGGFDMSFLSFLEVDVEGNVNVSKLAKKPYLTAGCGGFVDITANARKIVFSGWFEAGAEVALSESGLKIVRPGKFTKIVEKVEHVTFSGRRARAGPGRPLRLVGSDRQGDHEIGLHGLDFLDGRRIVGHRQGKEILTDDVRAGLLGVFLDPVRRDRPEIVVRCHDVDAFAVFLHGPVNQDGKLLGG